MPPWQIPSYQYDNPECGIGKRCIVTCHEIVVFLSNRYNRHNLESMISMMLLFSCSVLSDCLRPHRLQHARLLCPWNSPGKNTGVGCHSLSQGIFPTEGSNPGLLHCRQILYLLRHQRTPNLTISLCKGVLTQHYKNSSAKGSVPHTIQHFGWLALSRV